jgi:hypothetical protein
MSVQVQVDIEDNVQISDILTASASLLEAVNLSDSLLLPSIEYIIEEVNITPEVIIDIITHIIISIQDSVTIEDDSPISTVFINNPLQITELFSIDTNGVPPYEYLITIKDIHLKLPGNKRLNTVVVGYEGDEEFLVQVTSLLERQNRNVIKRSRTGKVNTAFVNLSGESFDVFIYKELGDFIKYGSS